MRLSLIVAVGENGVIGANGKLPWHLPADLKHFKTLTLGKPVIMGRKTFESIGKPLPQRQNIVVSRRSDYVAPGARVVPDLDSALWAAADVDEAMVIGGEALYRAALPLADRIYWTEIHSAPDGDTFFPDFSRSEWCEISREDFPSVGAQPAYSFVCLERAGATAR